jgi:hypothetical protein
MRCAETLRATPLKTIILKLFIDVEACSRLDRIDRPLLWITEPIRIGHARSLS